MISQAPFMALPVETAFISGSSSPNCFRGSLVASGEDDVPFNPAELQPGW